MLGWLEELGWAGPDNMGRYENNVFNMYVGFDGKKIIITITNHIASSALAVNSIESFTREDYTKMVTAIKDVTLKQFDDVLIRNHHII